MTGAPLGVRFDDAELEASVRADLASIEAALIESVASNDDFVGTAARYLVEAGGKRFRPLLCVLAAHFGAADRPEIVPASVVVELTHLATLYHDDVMDEASVRRGEASANARWDNTVAILTGDFLFSRASNLLADLGPWAVRLQARTFERLVIGQIRETVGPGEGVDPIEHHLAVITDKTGSLIATSAEFGAHFAGVPDDVTDTLRRFGERIGIAFQLSDDILDIASDSDESGKTPGTDLREGVPTLPVLYALQQTDPESERLRTLVSKPLVDDAEHAARFQHRHRVGDRRAPVRDHRQRIGQDRRIDGCLGLPVRHVAAHGVQLRHRLRAFARAGEQRFAEIDDGVRGDIGESRAEESGVAPGAAAEFDDARSRRQRQARDEFGAAAQQAFDHDDWTRSAMAAEKAKVDGDLAAARSRQQRATAATREIEYSVRELRARLGLPPGETP